MRVCLIRNPAAGTASTRDVVERVVSLCQDRGDVVEVVATTARGDAEGLASRAVAAGADLVVAAGGDGTINEVVNGLASIPEALSRARLALLPLGTGNDFARTLGVEDPEDAVDAIAHGRERRVDLVALGARVFLNASAGGFTAETSARVSSELKQAVGPLAYLIGGAQALIDYEPVRARVASPVVTTDVDLQLYAVCNGAYIGGGHQLAPSARPDDGLLDVCVVRASSTLDFLALLPRLSAGTHVDDEDVLYFRTREVTLTFERPIRVNTDGEVLHADRCEYRVQPGAVRVLAP